jgi:hypothetical protein
MAFLAAAWRLGDQIKSCKSDGALQFLGLRKLI